MAIASGGFLNNGGHSVSFPASSYPESSSTEHVTMELQNHGRSRRRAATLRYHCLRPSALIFVLEHHLRMSYASSFPCFHHLSPKKKAAPKSAVLAALSDTNSELAQFLFVKGGKEKGGTSAFFQSSVGKSVKRLSILGSNLMNGSSRGNGLEQSGEEEPESMESITASYYSLALAPMENRSARIIMLGEMFAVFGALFLAGTWIIWEWGSAKTYGGEGTNEIYNRVFNAIMASAITCNIMLALFGSFVWLNSILYGANEEDFVFEARHLLGTLFRPMAMSPVLHPYILKHF